MEQAGEGIARAVARFYPRPGKCVVFAGKGHNAGDAFVAARWLAQWGWKIETRLVFAEKDLSALTSKKLDAVASAVSADTPSALRTHNRSALRTAHATTGFSRDGRV